MGRLKYPFLALAGISTAAALLLLLAGGGGGRRVLPQAPFAADRVAVVELTGIMTAATSGLIHPAIASATPTAL